MNRPYIICHMVTSIFNDILGHTNASFTMDIYVDVTQELKQKEFEGLDSCFGQ